MRFLLLAYLFVLFAILMSGCSPEVSEPAASMSTLAPAGEAAVPPTLTETALLATEPAPTVTLTAEALPVLTPSPELFDGKRAFDHVAAQVDLGPRITGTDEHSQTIAYIADALEDAGWAVEVQVTEYQGHPIRNVIGRRESQTGEDRRSWLVLGAHYDTRMYADQDPDPEKRMQPVIGANDGASGVAVLLELARVLPASLYDDVWLVFFDAEDNGNILEYDWIMGSRAFVAALDDKPDAAVIVDMIGDADLNIYYETSSDRRLAEAIWAAAASLDYDQFIPEQKYHILDDHTPFLEADIPAVDIIDFDYEYWHTVEDTLDKVSAGSLEAVGRTLQVWLEGR